MWISGTDLASGAPRRVPASAVFVDEDIRRGWPPVIGSSSGAACRDTVADATTHAVMERVERDGVAIWWYNRIPSPRLAADATAAALPADLGDWLAGRRRRTWHLRLHSDLPVPAIVALSSASDGARPAIGAAAALDPAAAVLSATLEMLQCEIAIAHMRGAQAAPDPPPVPPLLAWSAGTNAKATPYLAGDGTAELPAPVAFDPLVEAFVARGIDVTVVDITRPAFAVPVVKAVSTTLRDWQPRFAPGRLYDVPVTLGLGRTPSDEADLNPVPFVI